MKRLILVFMLIISVNAMAQNNNYTILKDKDVGMIFNGLITFDDLNKEQSFTWLKSGRDIYSPNVQAVKYLTSRLKDFSMVVFLGTWCSDSHDLIPRLQKVLQMTNYPLSQLTMYGVDMKKKTTNGEEKKYAIEYVPTIILFNKEGKEIGRITESVQKSIEADMKKMVKKYYAAAQ